MAVCVFINCQEQAISRGVCLQHHAKFFDGPPVGGQNPIKAYRQQRGWSAGTMASHLGVAARTLATYERGIPPRHMVLAVYGLAFLHEIGLHASRKAALEATQRAIDNTADEV